MRGSESQAGGLETGVTMRAIGMNCAWSTSTVRVVGGGDGDTGGHVGIVESTRAREVG